MSIIKHLPTQYRETLTALHIAQIIKKIDDSEFGGHVIPAADSLRGGKGPAHLSDRGGITVTIWLDKEAKCGRSVKIIFDDCRGTALFKAYHTFQDAVDPTLSTGAYQG